MINRWKRLYYDGDLLQDHSNTTKVAIVLFILTGEVQSGKTRWLIDLIDKLTARGVTCHGVVSPGVWRRSIAVDGSVCFEKLGIEAVLLPERERLSFAQRRDLTTGADDCNPDWQSMQANLGWAIPDTALEAVNRHFDKLAQKVSQRQELGLLVVDELGRLELVGDGGFKSALKQLEAGPSLLYTHALAVVRSQLLEPAQQRLGEIWGSIELIAPDERSKEQIIRIVTDGDGPLTL